MNIAVVLGTRPELIKLAPVIKELARQAPGAFVDVVLTGQHTDMLNGILELFEISNVVELNINYKAPNLCSLTSGVLKEIDQQLFNEKLYDLVIVQGDTTTTMATALSCFYRKIPVAHVEAGLRTFDLEKPFPEELNRQIVTKLSKWHFCPTQRARKNLLLDGVSESQIEVCGNTVIDALQFVLDKKTPKNYEESILNEEQPELFEALESFKIQEGKTLSLFTAHRRENQGEDLENLFRVLRDTSEQFPSHHTIFPYHLNPNVKDVAQKMLRGLKNLHLIPPVSYRPMLYLMKKCDFAMSDSGGIQEELPSLKKPLLILRDSTERPEVIDAGFAKLIGTDPEKVSQEFRDMIANIEIGQHPKWFSAQGKNPYGDGDTSITIVDRLITDLYLEAEREKVA